MDNFDHGQHCVYKMHMHLVLVIKYRRKVITEDISNDLEKYFITMGEKHHVELMSWNYDVNKPDHIHILLKMSPQTSISSFMNGYKAVSARHIRRDYPEIKEMLWKDKFWSPSFFIASVSDVSEDIVQEYIRSQGEFPDRRKREYKELRTKRN